MLRLQELCFIIRAKSVSPPGFQVIYAEVKSQENVISKIHWTRAGSDLYDQRGGYNHVVGTQVLISLGSDLHINV